MTKLCEILARTGKCVSNCGNCLLEVATDVADEGALITHVADMLPLHLGHGLKRSLTSRLQILYEQLNAVGNNATVNNRDTLNNILLKEIHLLLTHR